MSEHEVEYQEVSELSAEDLENISGGLVVTIGDGARSLIIDDATGTWVEEVYDDLDDAIRDARAGGFGDTVYHAKDLDEYRSYLKKRSQ